MIITSANSWWRRSVILLVALLLTAGCREKEPTPKLMQDLGDGERVLLPVSSPWHDTPYNRGDTAQWVEFRPPDPDEPPAFGKEAAGEQMATNRALALIDRYQSLAAERDVEGVLALYVESQRESLRSMIEFGFKMFDRLETVQEVLLEKLPDEEDRINELFDGLIEQSNQLVRDRESLTVESAEAVTAPAPPGGPISQVRFLKQGDGWFIEYPNLPDLSAVMPMLEQQAGALDMAIQGLESGSVPAEQMLQQMETMAQAMQMMQGGTPPPGDADMAEDEEEVE